MDAKDGKDTKDAKEANVSRSGRRRRQLRDRQEAAADRPPERPDPRRVFQRPPAQPLKPRPRRGAGASRGEDFQKQEPP